jgi:hypothetical protein
MMEISALWRNPSGWVGDDPCHWPGVGCNVFTDGLFFRTQAISIVSISVRGVCSKFPENELRKCQIPNSLSKLQKLRHLYLNGNGFRGEIPDSLSTLPDLHSLYLNANQLVGTIPPSLGLLKMLEKLYLNGNQLSGTIPPELGNAGNLQQLELQQNEIQGTIPVELSKLTKLVLLDLNGC